MSDAPESEGEGFQDEGFEAGGEISEAMHRAVEDALVTYALDDAKTAFLEGRFAGVIPDYLKFMTISLLQRLTCGYTMVDLGTNCLLSNSV
mmetsp:Transcript_15490/g.39218  ORF Transcript_15490/g.39218 Transcript_15490/m.39218 type:complete len:91 (+) Transcript_15490:1118-1390(+)